MSEKHYKNCTLITEGKHKCTGCAVCATVCPIGCITMKEDEEGFLYPQIDDSACIGCKKCVKICTQDAEAVEKTEIYAAQSLDREVLKTSSSGGAFTELCRAFIDNGGYVAAAAFDETFKVRHIISNDLSELVRCRGAKYSQSDTAEVFERMVQMLGEGNRIMFVGTPCEAAAAIKLAEKNREGLTTVSFVCHGVPSPAVWRRYVEEKAEELGARISNIEMRNKDSGWLNYSMKISAENGMIYQAIKRNDAFLRGFLSDLYLRPSCHMCQYKGDNNVSDIIIADCWGAEKLELPFDIYDGVSMIVVKTHRGASLFSKIKEKVLVRQLSEDVLENNSAYTNPAKPNKKRKAFFKQFSKGEKNSSLIIEKLCAPTLKSRMKKWLKKRNK